MNSPRAALLLALLFVPVSAPAAEALRGAGAGSAPGFAHAMNSMSPPAQSTGGFGEDSCAFCHSDFDENEPGGTLEVLGLPADGYRPGQTLQLEVRLHHPELRRGGFQLTTRFAAGESKGAQAGTLEAGEGQRLQTPGYTPIAYLGHTLGGIEPTGDGERRWSFSWTAPESGGAVAIHVAGNAADGDGMEWGDRTYTLEVILPPR